MKDTEKELDGVRGEVVGWKKGREIKGEEERATKVYKSKKYK